MRASSDVSESDVVVADNVFTLAANGADAWGLIVWLNRAVLWHVGFVAACTRGRSRCDKLTMFV